MHSMRGLAIVVAATGILLAATTDGVAQTPPAIQPIQPGIQPMQIYTAMPIVSSAPIYSPEPTPPPPQPVKRLRLGYPGDEPVRQVANFEACNLNDFPLYFAIAYTSYHKLVTVGWKRADPGCVRIGRYPFQFERFGYYAMSKDGEYSWGGDTALCIQNVGSFKIWNADDPPCADGERWAGFDMWTPRRLHPENVDRQQDFEEVIRITFNRIR